MPLFVIARCHRWRQRPVQGKLNGNHFIHCLELMVGVMPWFDSNSALYMPTEVGPSHTTIRSAEQLRYAGDHAS